MTCCALQSKAIMKQIFILLIVFWNSVEFTWTERECSKLPTFKNAFVSDEYKKAQHQRGDVIYFSCDPGFTTGLNTSYVCTEYGWRAATIGQCIEMDTFPVLLGCIPPPPLKNGYALKKLAYFYENGQRVQFRCDPHYDLKGGPHVTCTNGQWTGNLQCVARFCEKPLVVNGEVQEDKEMYAPNDVLNISCNPGYTKADSEASVCRKANSSVAPQWSSVPQCEIIDCGEPAPLLNGGVSFVSGELNQYGSVVQYHCNEPYYSLPGAVNVSFICEIEGKWRPLNDTDQTATCLPVCGKPRVDLISFQRIIGGSTAPRGSIPWQVFIRTHVTAGGTLIADCWVLTVAQVLTHGMQPIQPNEVEIFLGRNVVANSPDTNATAASIHLHSGYNNPDQLDFNNDIALIKLTEPITFNQFLMPICLPPQDSSLQDGIMGVVSGFGFRRNTGSRSTTLQYVRLPVVNQRQCNISLNILKSKVSHSIPNVSDNMFCAGMPEGGKDACFGDSGGPFALWRKDHYTVAGIVSWGVGCADKGSYGFYTRVSRYVDWIHKTMEEN